MSQAFYCPHILTILRALTQSEKRLLPESVRAHGDRIAQSYLKQRRVPVDLIGCSFGQLYDCMVARNVVLLGLYRSPDVTTAPPTPERHHSYRGRRRLPYVYVNPRRDTVIRSGDRMYALMQLQGNPSV